MSVPTTPTKLAEELKVELSRIEEEKRRYGVNMVDISGGALTDVPVIPTTTPSDIPFTIPPAIMYGNLLDKDINMENLETLMNIVAGLLGYRHSLLLYNTREDIIRREQTDMKNEYQKISSIAMSTEKARQAPNIIGARQTSAGTQSVTVSVFPPRPQSVWDSGTEDMKPYTSDREHMQPSLLFISALCTSSVRLSVKCNLNITTKDIVNNTDKQVMYMCAQLISIIILQNIVQNDAAKRHAPNKLDVLYHRERELLDIMQNMSLKRLSDGSSVLTRTPDIRPEYAVDMGLIRSGLYVPSLVRW